MTDEELSKQYHSLRIYDGTYSTKTTSYTVGGETTRVKRKIWKYYDTWIDFHLIPLARPTLPVPSPNAKLVAVPGRTDPIDLTTYLTGSVTYKNRTGSIQFATDVDFVEEKLGGWVEFDKKLNSLFHGKVVRFCLQDDPAWFYAGYIQVAQWQTGQSFSTVTLNYDVYPFKKDMNCSVEMWLWDSFSFDDGIICYLNNITVDGSFDATVIGSTEKIAPRFAATNTDSASPMIVYKYENKKWVSYGNVPTSSITSKSAIIPRLIIDNGVNKLRFKGNGTVTMDYRRGML